MLIFNRAGFPLTKRKVCSLAYQFAHMNNIIGFSVKYSSAGKKWLKSFFWHHPEVRVKHAHNLSVNRAMCANPATMQKFFKQYQDTLKELKIESPQQIWNCDEMGCMDVPKERDVVGETGIEVVTIVSKEQGETSNVLTFANAMGQCVPPLIIHKEGKVPEDWEQGAPIGVMVRASPTGWINRNLFLEYATRWVRWLKSWKLLDHPHLLLLDVHKSDGKCTKKFPKDFTDVTMECDGYPQYRRRDNSKYVMKNGVPLDNRYIVPYNTYLSKKYNAHINVEICSTINSCKYLYKYVYKGPDMASVQVVDSQGDPLDTVQIHNPKNRMK